MFNNSLSQDQKNIIAPIVAIVIGALSLFYFLLLRRGKMNNDGHHLVGDEDWSSLYNDHSGSSENEQLQQVENDSKELRNVFDVKQDDTVIGTSSKNSESDEKPFKSSYYYAHNNPKSNGGYKDGLKAEDYVMNKPRLLKSVAKEKHNVVVNTAILQLATMPKNNFLSINKYLWDDDGNSNGVAKIIIDSLPSSRDCDKGAYIPWQQGIISKEDVKATLVGLRKDGLIVQIRSKMDDNSNYQHYQLLVPRMFGEVEYIKLILKPKKMIVKLNKMKSKDNMKAWPQLPSKIAKPTQISEADIFNQDLFNQSSDK